MSAKRLHYALVITSLTGGVFYIDRLTKNQFFSAPEQTIIPFVLGTTHHQNHGLLANIHLPMIVILCLTTAICIGILIATIQELGQKNPLILRLIAYALILGGALGNLFDRIQYGYVFDWILIFTRSIINIADLAIAIGMIGWIYSYRLTAKTKNESSI